jgi:hypothetical protein
VLRPLTKNLPVSPKDLGLIASYWYGTARAPPNTSPPPETLAEWEFIISGNSDI